jgi:hypothetical protein
MAGGDLQPGALDFGTNFMHGSCVPPRVEAITVNDSTDYFEFDVTEIVQKMAASGNTLPLAFCFMADSVHMEGSNEVQDKGKLNMKCDEEFTPYDKLIGLEVTDVNGTHMFKFKKDGGDPVNNIYDRIQYTSGQNGFGGTAAGSFTVGGCWGSDIWDGGYTNERENRCAFFFHRGLASALGWSDPAYPADVIAVEGGKANARLNLSLQNMPNPFTGATRISYTLDKNIPVQLSVYDVSGKLVKTLVSSVQTAGSYTASWDAKNMPMGIYMLRLKAGDRTLNRKMIVMK